MKSVKFHVTDIDSFTWYRKLESLSDKEMRNRLLRLEPTNERMRIGTIWHEIMEMGANWHSVIDTPSSQFTTAIKDGYTFHIECDSEIILPQICEIRAEKIYCIDGYNIILSGQTDGMMGNKLIDHKLTFNPHIENYFEAYQWKAYLDIFNADSFEYIVYSAKQKGTDIAIRDISKLTVYKYPEMINDLKEGICDLLGFVEKHVPEMII